MSTARAFAVVVRGLLGLVIATSPASLISSCGTKDRGEPVVVSADGAIGPLRIDESTPKQIEAVAGTPEYKGAGRFRPLIPDFAPFVAFGYGCRHVRSGGIPTMSFDKKTGAPEDSHVSCRTVYYVSRRTGRLAGFSTTSRAFRTASGISPGTSLAAARRIEHGQRLMDSPVAFQERGAAADLLIYASIVVPKHGDWRVGKTVDSLALETRRHHGIGLEFV